MNWLDLELELFCYVPPLLPQELMLSSLPPSAGLLSLSYFPHFYSESLTHPIFCVNSDLGYIGMQNFVSGVLLKFVFLMI